MKKPVPINIPQAREWRGGLWTTLSVTLWMGVWVVASWIHVGGPDIGGVLDHVGDWVPVTGGVFFRHLMTLLCALVPFSAAFLAGRAALRRLKLEVVSLWEEWALAGGFAVILLSAGFFALGAVRVLTIPAVRVYVACLGVLGLLGGGRSRVAKFTSRWDRELWTLPGAMTLAILGVGFVTALGPEIFYDSLVYHLAIPKLHLLAGRLLPIAHNLFDGVPMSVQFYVGMGLAFGGEGPAKLMCWFLFPLCGAVMMAWAGGRAAGVWSALLFLATPLMMLKMGVVGNDAGTTFFVLLAVWTAGKCLEEKQPRVWGLISGVFLGAALGAKYTVWALGPLLVGVLFWWGVRSEKGVSRPPWLWMAVSALVLLAPWLVKNALYYHNPIFPMFHDRIAGVSSTVVNWPRAEADAGGRILAQSFSTLSGALGWLTSFWGESLKSPDGADSRFVGPMFGALLPALGFVSWRQRKDQLAGVSLLGLFVFWMMTTSMLRHFSSGLALLAVLGARVFIDADSSWVARLRVGAFKVFVIISAGLQIFWAIQITSNTGLASVISGRSSADDFRSATRATYPYPSWAGFHFINQHTPITSRVLLVGEARGFGLERSFIASSPYNRSALLDVLGRAQTSQEIYNNFLQAGVTHLLINPLEAERLKGYCPLVFSPQTAEGLKEFFARYTERLWVEERAFPYTQGVAVYRVRAADEAPQKAPLGPLPFVWSLSTADEGRTS